MTLTPQNFKSGETTEKKSIVLLVKSCPSLIPFRAFVKILRVCCAWRFFDRCFKGLKRTTQDRFVSEPFTTRTHIYSNYLTLLINKYLLSYFIL